jgi:hypothetical protein
MSKVICYVIECIFNENYICTKSKIEIDNTCVCCTFADEM